MDKHSEYGLKENDHTVIVERKYEMLGPLQKAIAHLQTKIEYHHKYSKHLGKEVPNLKKYPKNSGHKRRSLPRRHTLTGMHHAPILNKNKDIESCSSGDEENAATPSGFPEFYLHSRDGIISPSEAERKRSAFFRYLECKYPQHAKVISENVRDYEEDLGRTRFSYAAESSFHNSALTSSSNDSEVVRYGSLSRGNRLRSSLPIIRSRSRSRESPLGVIYLEYCGERRVAILPNELTSLDTIRALFVQTYPGLLTMPMLDPQRHAIHLKNKKSGNYDEIENVSCIKDRSIIRVRPTGIPTPGNKKTTNSFKPRTIGLQNNQNTNNNNNNKVLERNEEDISVTERNQRNFNKHKSGIKAPVKSLIRQYQSAPSLIKYAVTSSQTRDTKTSSRLPQKSSELPTKSKGKAPIPPPRSTKPTLLSLKPENAHSNIPTTNNNLRSGNGLGGGSVPQKGFSFIRSNHSASKPCNEMQDELGENITDDANSQRDLNVPVSLGLSPLCADKTSFSHPQHTPAVTVPINKASSVTTARQLEPSVARMDAPQQNRTILQTSPQGGNNAIQYSKVSTTTTTQSGVAGSRSISTKSMYPQVYQPSSNNPPNISKIPDDLELTNQLSIPESSLMYSHTNKTSSPERRATINSSGGSAGYCKGGRSFKGHQLKPVSIPIVPDVTSKSISNPEKNASPSDLSDITKETAELEEISNDYKSKISSISAEKCADTLITPNNTMSSLNDREEIGKCKQTLNKKGLFGLRRHVSNKSNGNRNPVSSAKYKNPVENDSFSSFSTPSPKTDEIHSTQRYTVSHLTSSESSLSSVASRLPSLGLSKSYPLSSGKATIPKTDILHNIVTRRSQLATSLENKMNSAHVKEASSAVISTASSEDEKEIVCDVMLDRATVISNHPGVLKNGNLVKSISSSSIPSDSGASNLSTTPSLRTKKVSFQDDVTVFSSNGISTFSNGLRQSDTDDIALDQSLSCDINEQNAASEDEKAVVSWNGEPFRQDYQRNDVQQMGSNVINGRYRPSTPRRSELPLYGDQTYQSNSLWSKQSNMYSHVAYQSAVAAAIESISGKQPTTTYNGGVNNSLRQTTQRHQPFSVSCTSPVPFVTRHEQNETKPKEQWSSQVCMSVTDTAYSTDNPGINLCRNLSKSDPNGLSTPSYFQTQGTRTENYSSNEPFNADTPPYYECCETTVKENQLSEALANVNVGSKIEEVKAETNRSQEENSEKGQVFESNNHAVNTTPNVDPPMTFLSKNDKPGSATSSRMVEMERHLASLTGMVESIITSQNEFPQSVLQGGGFQSQSATGKISDPLPFATLAGSNQQLKKQLLKLRSTANDLKEQLNELKRQQRKNMEQMNEMVNEKARDMTQFISNTAGAKLRPLRMRRIRLDQERHSYGLNASRTERQLSDVEAAVEELRNEVVERRCRVNAKEVEALVLQLSQAGRTVAQLKGSFPTLCEEIRAVGSGENEVIFAEEKFIEAEPPRLDDQLKRCKQLTATLFTLKKLATVQEARSKTPTSFASLRPTTPSQLMPRNAWEDPKLQKKRVLDDVKRTRVDHARRMESIQALEVAEKALNKTDYLSHIEQRRQKHLTQLYNQRDVDRPQESNLTTSESSSVESLPPPPPPLEATDRNFPEKAITQPGYYQFPPSYIPPVSQTDFHYNQLGNGSPVISSDVVGYLSSNHSPVAGRHLPLSNTGSLPKSYMSLHHYGYGMSPPTARRTPANLAHPQWGQQIDRPHSVPLQQINLGRMTPTPFKGDLSERNDIPEQERQRFLEQQQQTYMEKNQRLKEQYSKLQQLQKRQRQQVIRKNANQNKSHPPPPYQPISLTSAKSSDV
ncbi:uncharacterized protein LOC143469837 isoform X3 [Clavelina lepadiformis]|uniref:uncharacterized protein LOC143469837 isoform X3 n=1 Tax=Clavelina lepadiformis TaxID=159417 RepID=UPI0040437BBE